MPKFRLKPISSQNPRFANGNGKYAIAMSYAMH